MRALLVSCCLVAALSGCSAGQRMGASELRSLEPSPAVRWVYKPGWQIGTSFLLLCLPMIVPDEVHEMSVGDDCIVVKEVGSYAPEVVHCWHEPHIVVSIQDGQVLLNVPKDPRPASNVNLSFEADHTPYARLGGDLTIINRTFSGTSGGGSMLLQSERFGSVELFSSKEFVGGPIAYAEVGDDILVIAFVQMVICVDKTKLPQKAATRQAAGSR